MHPRFELPPASDINKELPKRPPVCHNCGELGHKASFCPKLPAEQREAERLNALKNPIYNHHAQQKLQSQMREQQKGEDNGELNKPIPNTPLNAHPPGPPPHHRGFNQNQPRPPFQPRKLEEITCFKCGMKGHYANRCYSFLNNSFMGNKQS
jgi:cleavage and polyadenylation specificity factor subunit 4